MAENQIMILGEKETFLIRVLAQKLDTAGCKTIFTHWSVDAMSAAWEGTCLAVLYIEDYDSPDPDALIFLRDKLDETEARLIVIGIQNEIDSVLKSIPREMIAHTFLRPIDAGEFATYASGIFNKLKTGGFRKSILVVDDDPNYLALVREWLKDSYKVSMVNSGLQAIKWLGKNKADLILLDHEMPVTSGPQVLEMLRSDSETTDIPVIFLTGKSDKESVLEVVNLKPEGYFLKNIEKKELLSKLSEFFILHNKG